MRGVYTAPQWEGVMGYVLDRITADRRAVHAEHAYFERHVHAVIADLWAKNWLPCGYRRGYVAGLKVYRHGFGSVSVYPAIVGPLPPSRLELRRSVVKTVATDDGAMVVW